MVCVRTRPINIKEWNQHDIDIITVATDKTIVIHEPKVKLDLSRHIENQKFRFDYVFDETCNNELIYEYTTKALVESIFEGGLATCFAYGQTGSGKTYTMCGEFGTSFDRRHEVKGIYHLAGASIFSLKNTKYADANLAVEVSFFEIYGSKIFDLLNDKKRLIILEDNKNQIQLVGLKCKQVEDVDSVLGFLKIGSFLRRKGQTSQNENSSRSHAIFQILLKNNKTKKIVGKLCLIDLAGNERGADTVSSNRDVRFEGAEINKSLLVLKECIRALGRKGSYLPFRGSKLTLILRDFFINDRSQICMIALMSPNLSFCENTLNTLRYADRVKELSASDQGQGEFSEKDVKCLEHEVHQDTSRSQKKVFVDEVILKHQELLKEYIPSSMMRHEQIFNTTRKADYSIEDYSRNLEEALNTDIEVLSNLQRNLRDICEMQKNMNKN